MLNRLIELNENYGVALFVYNAPVFLLAIASLLFKNPAFDIILITISLSVMGLHGFLTKIKMNRDEQETQVTGITIS